MPRPPFEKQWGIGQFCLGRHFPFPPRRNKEETDSENEMGMSKRKNEVVFTLIQERQSQNPQPLFSSFPLVVGKAPCLSQMCYIPHEE
jgi:hypothetical protein